MDPFLSEIRIMAFSYPPRGWTLCNGQLLPINQYNALFSLLGTTYGGDGVRTFGLPNLSGRVPTHAGEGLVLGQRGGEESHTLSVAEMPQHTHSMVATAKTAGAQNPGPNYYLGEGVSTSTGSPAVNIYSTGNSSTTFASAAIRNSGDSQPHENRQPFLVLSFCIALQGIYPTPN